jgi:hypothetical protein
LRVKRASARFASTSGHESRYHYTQALYDEAQKDGDCEVRRHAGLDTDQARWHVGELGSDPAASKLLTQNDRSSMSSRPNKCSVFLPVSMPMVLTTASVLFDMAKIPRASKPPKSR